MVLTLKSYFKSESRGTVTNDRVFDSKFRGRWGELVGNMYLTHPSSFLGKDSGDYNSQSTAFRAPAWTRCPTANPSTKTHGLFSESDDLCKLRMYRDTPTVPGPVVR